MLGTPQRYHQKMIFSLSKAAGAQRAVRKFHRRCDRLGIPDHIRERQLKSAFSLGEKPAPPDWYAGATVPTPSRW